MQLSDIMEAGVLTISANDYAIEALRLMAQRDFPWVIVLDGDQIAGLVFAQELARRPETVLKERDVREYLRANLLTIQSEAQPQEAERLLRNSGMGFAIVVRNNLPVGVITADNLTKRVPHHRRAS